MVDKQIPAWMIQPRYPRTVQIRAIPRRDRIHRVPWWESFHGGQTNPRVDDPAQVSRPVLALAHRSSTPTADAMKTLSPCNELSLSNIAICIKEQPSSSCSHHRLVYQGTTDDHPPILCFGGKRQ
jgi:hypothetical protein